MSASSTNSMRKLASTSLDRSPSRRPAPGSGAGGASSRKSSVIRRSLRPSRTGRAGRSRLDRGGTLPGRMRFRYLTRCGRLAGMSRSFLVRPVVPADVPVLDRDIPTGRNDVHARFVTRSRDRGDVTYLAAWLGDEPYGTGVIRWTGLRERHPGGDFPEEPE